MGTEELDNKTEADKIQQMADLVHEIWSHWMRSVFNRSAQYPDGTVIIPAGLVKRWQRQIQTPYEDLKPEEQKSDIAIARQILQTVNS